MNNNEFKQDMKNIVNALQSVCRDPVLALSQLYQRYNVPVLDLFWCVGVCGMEIRNPLPGGGQYVVDDFVHGGSLFVSFGQGDVY